MSQSNDIEEHSDELFNTEDLMESEELNVHKNTDQTEQNSEDHETQINDFIINTEDHNTEIDNENLEDQMETEDIIQEENEPDNSEQANPNPVKKKIVKSIAHDRITELPLAKVKHIIKLDPDVKLISGEAIFLITKTTEMFIKTLAKEAFGYAAQNKKKTIAKNHVEQALAMLPIEL